MMNKPNETYYEVGHHVYRVIRTRSDYKAFGLGEHGEQIEVSSGSILADGLQITKKDYEAEVRAAKARKKAAAKASIPRPH